MHLLVTGGSSELAQATVEGLLARGHRVSWSGPPIRPTRRGSFAHVDRGEAPWRSVDFRSLDGILHLAGPRPGQHLDEETLRRQLRWERTLLRRAAARGVERVVTIGVVSNPRVQDHPFVRLKRQTETLLRELGIPATVFRAPWLYGSRDDFLERLWRWIRRRSILLVPQVVQAPVQLCYERRLAEAVVQAIERPPGRLRIYEAATTTPLPLSALIHQLAQIVRGEPPRMISVGERPAYHLRGPLKLVGLIPLRSPMWNLLAGGLTCATTAFSRDFDVEILPAEEALVRFVRGAGRGLLWWERSVGRPLRAAPR